MKVFSKVKDAFMRSKVGKAMGAATMSVVALVTAATAASASPPDPGLDFGTGGFDFQLSDVVGTAWNFLGIFPIWVQLVLGIILSASFIGFILWIFGKLPKWRSKSS